MESGPQSHFCPEIVRKSTPSNVVGMAPTDWAPSASTGTPLRSRSSASGRTAPVVHSTCEVAISRVRDVTAARIASGSGSTTTTRAGEAPTGPSSPKCSSVVVTISSSGPRPRPRSTIAQASVVESVRATWATSASTRAANAARASSRSASVSSKYALPLRPRRRSSATAPVSASATGRARGPNVPAFRYATASRTGNSCRASSSVTPPRPRRAPRRRGGRRARRHSARAAPGATRRPGPRGRRARARGRSRSPDGNTRRGPDRRR